MWLHVVPWTGGRDIVIHVVPRSGGRVTCGLVVWLHVVTCHGLVHGWDTCGYMWLLWLHGLVVGIHVVPWTGSRWGYMWFHHGLVVGILSYM